ncbi:ketopantoate reductase family protein [Thermodesulfovibrio sp. Kuro-1]|uniref:ketopantoate reductase family protein n=1 Tax=Thermodesulfovibrio sp. Kuro-1 TaxID=2580394 RepID=UPI001142BCE0|nr:2-dehydropantoate 2-reductase [Thermodesulfovibrio sp. Kuro-1]
MKILIFGLGALGTVFATSLKASGETVFGITKDKYIGKIRNKTLEIKGLFGEKRAQLDNIFTSSEQIQDRDLDLIIVSVKAYDTEIVINQIKPLLGQNTLVLLAQNGYGNYEIASSVIGKERVILSRIIFGAKIVEPAIAEVTVFADDIVIGQPDNMIPEKKLNEIADIFNKAGLPTRVSKEVYAILWDKILYNSALNPLGAILECNYGTLAKHEETRKIMNKIVEEIFNVAKFKKIKLNWADYKEYLNYFYEKLVPPTAKHFPSMYYDIKNGKKTEIDAFNGAIVKLAKQCNLSIPVNETITNLVKVKENLI